MITTDSIIEIASVITAFGVILGGIFAGYRWYLKQEQQSKDIQALADKETKDLKEITDKQATENTGIKKEQEVICFALFACLDGLHQLGANGNVTKALETLEKHLNQSAHE